MKTRLQLAFSISMIAALAGCQQESAPAPASAPAPTATAAPQAAAPAPAQAVAQPAAVVSVDPATMAACDPAVEATVRWDVRATHPDIATVAVYVGNGSDQKLFAQAGASGEAKTGPWTRPGTTFQLKNNASGELLGEATVGGPSCP